MNIIIFIACSGSSPSSLEKCVLTSCFRFETFQFNKIFFATRSLEGACYVFPLEYMNSNGSLEHERKAMQKMIAFGIPRDC